MCPTRAASRSSARSSSAAAVVRSTRARRSRASDSPSRVPGRSAATRSETSSSGFWTSAASTARWWRVTRRCRRPRRSCWSTRRGSAHFSTCPVPTARSSADELDLDRVLAARALHVAGALVMPALDGEPTASLLAEAQRRGVHDVAGHGLGRDGEVEPARAEPAASRPALSEPRRGVRALGRARAGGRSRVGSCEGRRDSRDHARCRRVLRRGRRVRRARRRSPRRCRRRDGRRRRVRRRADLRPPPGLAARAGERFRQQGRGRRDDGGRRGGGAAQDRGGARVIARLNRLFAADGKLLRRRRRPRLLRRGLVPFRHRGHGGDDRHARRCRPRRDPALAGPGAAACSGFRGRASRRSCFAPMSRTSTARRCRSASSASSSRERSSVRCSSTPRASSSTCCSCPDEPELLHQCVCNVSALRAACDRVGMPLMVEPLVFAPGERGYGSDGDVEKIVPLVRQAVELGADVIKCDPTDELADFARVLQVGGATAGARARRRQGARRRDSAPHRGADAARAPRGSSTAAT